MRLLIASSVACSLLILVACSQNTVSQAGPLKLTKLTKANQPLQVVDAGQGYLWVVEKGGKIIALRNGKQAGTVINLSGEVSQGGEQGLLAVAKRGPYAYLYLTDKNGDSRLLEYSASAKRINRQTRRQLLFQSQPEDNHNGGSLLFGPDGYLYLGLGDGGGGGDEHGARGNSQNLNSLLGKILRIDPRGDKPYAIPKDNPLIGKGRPEIWAYGLRNPWRSSFDSKGNLWVGDVGQDKFEEVNKIGFAGANLGWRVFEGNSRYRSDEEADGALAPVFDYPHDQGRCSVVGGLVIESNQLPSIKNNYLFTDTCDGRLRAFDGQRVNNLGLRVASPVSVDRDRQGRVYISSLSGTVYRLVANN